MFETANDIEEGIKQLEEGARGWGFNGLKLLVRELSTMWLEGERSKKPVIGVG